MCSFSGFFGFRDGYAPVLPNRGPPPVGAVSVGFVGGKEGEGMKDGTQGWLAGCKCVFL